MFEKTLTDLVKGVRAHKKTEEAYISSAIKECKDELSSTDLELKTEARRPALP